MKYSKYIKINPVFQNSINLQFDINSEKKIREYIPTREACAILGLYIDSILPNGNKGYRSTLFYGPYGKGKSFLILILLYIISSDCTTEVYISLLKKIKETDRSLFDKIISLNKNKIRLLPVLINSDYDDLNQAFIIGLTEAQTRANLENIVPKSNYDVAIEIIDNWLDDKKVNDSIIKVCQDKMKMSLSDIKSKLLSMSSEGYNAFCSFYECVSGGLPFNPLIKKNIASNLETVTERVSNIYSGLFIVFDEFGKFLDSGLQGLSQQLKSLQDVFELALRSSDNRQIHLCCINHKKISAYAKNALKDHALSFRAIEGRVKEISFTRTMSENYNIIAKAIFKDPNYYNYLVNTLDIKQSERYKWFINKGFVDLKSADTLFYGCFPLNPISAYSLIQLSELVAQNERTLFTFISDNDLNSLNSFLHNNSEGEYCVDKLYDYFSPLLGKENDKIKSIWIKAESILEELIDINERSLIKAIAISMILNDSRMFPCTEEYLQNSLSFDINNSLKGLEEKNYITKELITNQYCISSYSNREIKQAIKNYQSAHRNINISEELSLLSPISFVSARKYNAENKMTRYYHTVYIEDKVFIDSVVLRCKSSIDCDGIIYQILNTGDVPFKDIQLHYKEIEIEECVIVGYSKYNINEKLRGMVSDFVALDNLCSNKNYGTIILNEMNILKEQNLYGIENELQLIFNSSAWLNDSSNTLSEIMYKQLTSKFPHSLLINNELLNKHILSSSYKKARDIIVDRIIDSNFDNSDLSPSSAEMTVYNSVFDEKNNGVDIVVNSISNLILQTSGEKRSFEDLTNLLLSKPFGVREGVMPLLIAKSISMLSGNFILYLSSKEVELDSKNIGKAVDHATDFSFYYEKDDANKTEFLYQIAKEFGVATIQNFSKDLSLVVSAMQKYFSLIPSIVRLGNADEFLCIDTQTRKLIRSLLKYDLNKYELVFTTIPRVYDSQGDDNFGEVLNKVVMSKKLIERCIYDATSKISKDVLLLFNGNPNESIKSAISFWIINNKARLKNTDLLNSIEKKTFDYLLSDALPSDNSEIVNMVSRIVKGSIILDWQKDFSNEVLDVLSQLKHKIEISNEKESNTGKPILQPLSPLGNVLKRNLLGTINDYGESLSDEEKRNVLRVLMEEMGL